MTLQQQLILALILDHVGRFHGKDVRHVRAEQVTTEGDVLIARVEFT